MMSYDYPHPVSRTYQYKKITKPLLERKRRARINRCLDELKDLMVDALETEGENISKLEKADILELTVRHLQRLHASRSSLSQKEDAEGRWQSGFGHCAAEACKYLASLPGESGEKLARHLATGLQSTSKFNIEIIGKEQILLPILQSLDSEQKNAAPPIIPPPTPHLDDEETVEPQAKKRCSSPSRRNEQKAATEDEEEIDVERVDEGDPWRPW